MSDEIVADYSIILKNGAQINKQSCRLTFDRPKNMIRFKTPSEQVCEYFITQFINRPLKTIKENWKPVTMSLNFDMSHEMNQPPSNVSNRKMQLKIYMKHPHCQFSDYVRDQINAMFEACKSEMPKTRKSPPVLGPSPVFKKAEVDVYDKSSLFAVKKSKSSEKIQISQSQEKLKYNDTMIKNSDPIDTKVDIRCRTPAMRDPEVSRPSKIGQPPFSVKKEEVEIEEIKEIIKNEPIVSPKQQARTDWENEMLGDSFDHRKLYNIGNSCYFNSTMQALSSCFPLASRCSVLANHAQFPNDPEKKIQVFRRFCRIMKSLRDLGCPLEAEKWTEPRSTMSTLLLENFRRAFGVVHEEFQNAEQQDAHEYLINLLGILDDVMVNRAKLDGVDLNANPVDFGSSMFQLNPMNVFRIKFEVRDKCQHCDMETTRFDSRIDLSLAVRDKSSVQELLEPYGKWTAIERTCSACQQGSMSSTCERIVHFPSCLIVNLKRYERKRNDGGNYQYHKTSCSVSPSFTLDLSGLTEFTEFHSHPELDSSIRESISCRGGSDMDVILEKGPEHKEHKFQWLTETQQFCEKFGMSLAKNHVRNLEKCEISAMSKFDKPGNSREIEGDGNCFYRAISWCLTGSEEHHSTIREKMCEFLDVHAEKWKKKIQDDFEQKREIIERDGEWAETPQIIATAAMLNVTIYTYLDTQRGWIEHRPHSQFESMFPPASGAIYLQNIENHYQPVLSLKSTNGGNSRKRRARDGADGDGAPRKNQDPEYKDPDEKATPRRRTAQRASKRRSSGGSERKKRGELAEQRGHEYELSSVVCHLGSSPDQGHYVAYTKSFLTQKWLYCSDDVIYEVAEHRVADAISTSGYVLFYTRS